MLKLVYLIAPRTHTMCYVMSYIIVKSLQHLFLILDCFNLLNYLYM